MIFNLKTILNFNFCFIFVIFIFISSNAQSSSDFKLINNHIKLTESDCKQNKIKFQKSLHPFKAIAFVTIFFYQKIISEQISAGCEFDMSCSNFGIYSIKEFGIIKAVCLTADRLTRCNGLAQSETENYLINHTTGKVIDEPKMYRFKN